MSLHSRIIDEEDSDEVRDEDDFVPAGAETPEEAEDNVRKIFREDLDEAWKLEQEKPKNKDARVKYTKDHYNNWAKKMPDGRNFLHFLADQTDHTLCQTWVVARAVTKLPDLMGDLDREERTPLTLAVHRRNMRFIFAIFENVNQRKLATITKALKNECHSTKNEDRPTLLHAAISSNIGNDYIHKIINLVPDDMFSVADLRGRTPLHLAVEYQKINSDQFDIVKNLLERGSRALKVRTSEGRGKQLSVYQYHEKTRRDFKEKEPRAEHRKGMRRPTVVAVLGADSRDEKLSSIAKNNEITRFDRSSRGTDWNQTIGDHRRPPNGLPPTPTGNQETMTLITDSIKPEIFQTNSRPISKSEKTNHEKERLEAERQSYSIELLILLKLEYLRNMKPLEVLEYIHIEGQKDKELWFDFGPRLPGKIKISNFKKQFDHLVFDEVLQYAAFPQLQLDDSNEDSDGYHENHKGRQDMRFFFDWLRGRGVKRILRVEVDDMEMPCHSDEGIEQALEGFHVEVLDWKRRDLDPGTLHRIGSDLREVHLYWSGGNNVLRSWSEKEGGLCQAQSLEKITLTQVEGLESDLRTQHNLEIFRERLEESWKEEIRDTTPGIDSQNKRTPNTEAQQPTPSKKSRTLEIELSSSNVRGVPHRQLGQSFQKSAIFHQSQPQVDQHRWMECMGKFAESFRQIPELRKERSDTGLNPVTIALIDDGVDIAHPELRGIHNRNLSGKSFDYSEDEWCRVSPYWISVSGHGTLMARLIRRICPSANIHVIKVRTIPAINSNKVQIDVESTIKAIKYAINIGAHIISMSWTTKPPVTEKNEFDKVISEAGSKPTLMFCAASDQGQFEDFTYPHASNPALTFRVGAAKATGNAAEFVGDSLSFVFPGQDVVLSSTYAEEGYDGKFEKFASHTGSSIATALAAGLAAMVYECVRLGVIHTNNPQTKTHGPIPSTILAEICKKTRMNQCLESIGVNRKSGNPYLEVWKRFEDPGKEISRLQYDKEAQLDVVSGLARLLLEMT